MEKYAALLQLITILFMVFIFYFLIKYVIYLIKKNRLVDFSLKVRSNKNNPLLRVIHNLSKVLKKIPFIKAKKYNPYARMVRGFDDGYDVLASKILCSLFITFLYLFVSFLYRENIYLVIILVSLILGYVLLDFYFIYNSRNTTRLVNKDMLGAVIIMNNDFKANRSVEQAINDVIERKNGAISNEFKKVLDDTKLGLSYGEAFMRMYKRTGIDSVLDISHALTLYNMIGSDLIEIFSSIEKKIIEDEKFSIQVRAIKIFNRFFKIVFNFLPIFMVGFIFFLNDRYYELLVEEKGILLIIGLFALFICYIVAINKIVRRYNYDNK